MDSDDSKKYTILENVLQKINQKYIALPEAEKKRNNKILQVIHRIIQTLRNKCVLFNNLYQNIFYGGSYYDGLKVGSPTEYDLDCLLKLPKIAEAKVVVSDKPGYVHIEFANLKALEQKLDEASKYVGLNQLLVGNRICTKKVKSWMEKLFSTAINGTKKTEIYLGESKKCVVSYKMVKSGPAYTIIVEDEKNNFTIDIDLVPCFTFSNDQWPQQGYKPNVSHAKNSFFVVPKSPSESLSQYWRLSFQEQERELLNGCAVMKPSIRLIKKIRDRYQHKIASYYIKTVFLLEVEKVDKCFWSQSLSQVFVTMLKKYCEYLERKNIPYYWNPENNLIGDLSDETIFCIMKKTKRIVESIDRICDSKTDIYDVVSYFLRKEDVDMEVFKQEVPLAKKFKNVETPKNLESSFSSAESSICSFEEITKEKLDEPSTSAVVPESLLVLTRIEHMLATVITDQQRIYGMLQCAMDKIEQCENKISDLKIEIEKNKLEQTLQNQEMMKKIDEINRKDTENSPTLSFPPFLNLDSVVDNINS